MRSLHTPEDRLKWLEANNLIQPELGAELKAFATATGLNGLAPMYGFTDEAARCMHSQALLKACQNSSQPKETPRKKSPRSPRSPELLDSTTEEIDTNSAERLIQHASDPTHNSRSNRPREGEEGKATEPTTGDTREDKGLLIALEVTLAQSQHRTDHKLAHYSERIRNLDRMSENVIGVSMLPLSVVPNVLIDGNSYTIPVSTEEPSVVAALSHGAKIFRYGKGVRTYAPADQHILGQIIFQTREHRAQSQLNESVRSGVHKLIMASLPNYLPNAHKYGKGIVSTDIRNYDGFLVVEVGLDTGEAMGANMINGFLEKVAPNVETYLLQYCAVQRLTSILSNMASGRVYEAVVVLTAEHYAATKGISVTEATKILHRIALLSRFAEIDANRRITHNKGVLNGVSGVALACGQDTRALDVANCQLGHDKPLVTYRYSKSCELLRVTARIAAPVGIIGGSCDFFWGLDIMSQTRGVRFNSNVFGRVLAAVGLLQNFSALQALVTEGIQRGHMELHARKTRAANEHARAQTSTFTPTSTQLQEPPVYVEATPEPPEHVSSIIPPHLSPKRKIGATANSSESTIRTTIGNPTCHQDLDRNRERNSDMNRGSVFYDSLRQIETIIDGIQRPKIQPPEASGGSAPPGAAEYLRFLSPTRDYMIRSVETRSPTALQSQRYTSYLTATSPLRSLSTIHQPSATTQIQSTRASTSTSIQRLSPSAVACFSDYSRIISTATSRMVSSLDGSMLSKTQLAVRPDLNREVISRLQTSYSPNRLNSFTLPMRGPTRKD